MPAQTPPMGWNTWNAFGPDISEKLIREAAARFRRDGSALFAGTRPDGMKTEK